MSPLPGGNGTARGAAARSTGGSILQNGSQRKTIELDIEDDGTGWTDAAATAQEGQFGLLGMRERVVALDGTLSIGASRTGGASLQVKFCIQETAA